MKKADFYFDAKGSKTDVTKEIEKILADHGTCLLGPGTHCVSGVKMPVGTSIIGMGNATKLLLDPELTSGYTVSMNSCCTVKNLAVIGSEEEIALPSEIGTRHGILFEGNARETKAHADQPKHLIINACFISGFTGGGIMCYNTGYSPSSSMTASDCHIWNCGAGIYIPYFSEYHEFTNILSTKNLYGCINNGGNNVFVNCGFNCNVTGFVIDNADGKANNQSHGSAVGCTFNHSDGNKGVGIAVYNAKWGYVFSSCQLFYSKVIVEDSTNITFNAFNIGKSHLFDIKRGDLTMLSNCVFPAEAHINVEDNDAVRVVNCYTQDGKEVTI